jgi:hypothetical protein
MTETDNAMMKTIELTIGCTRDQTTTTYDKTAKNISAETAT